MIWYFPISDQTKVLIRLRRCAGWSVPLLFANPEDRFSHVEANISTMLCHSSTSLEQIQMCVHLISLASGGDILTSKKSTNSDNENLNTPNLKNTKCSKISNIFLFLFSNTVESHKFEVLQTRDFISKYQKFEL